MNIHGVITSGSFVRGRGLELTLRIAVAETDGDPRTPPVDLRGQFVTLTMEPPPPVISDENGIVLRDAAGNSITVLTAPAAAPMIQAPDPVSQDAGITLPAPDAWGESEWTDTLTPRESGEEG